MDAPGASQEALAVDVGEAILGDGRKVQVLGRRPGPRARRAVDACESHRRLVRAAVADVWGLAALDDASAYEGRHGDGVVRHIVAVARVAVVARFLGTVITAPMRGPTRLVRPAPLAVAAALASQARPDRVAVRNARAATATRGSRLRTPLRGDEGYRDENAGLSIHLSL